MVKKIVAGIVISAIAIMAAVVAIVVIMTPTMDEEEDLSIEERREIEEFEADLSESEEEESEEAEEIESEEEAEEEDESDKPDVEDIDIEIGNIFFKVLEHIQDMEEPMTPAEVADFKKEFDMLNEEQKTENISHAVNLIGDDNFAALSAILFDLSESKEIMETIFHDLLNRDEELKNETLRRLAEMSDHPLCEDAAELLDEEN